MCTRHEHSLFERQTLSKFADSAPTHVGEVKIGLQRREGIRLDLVRHGVDLEGRLRGIRKSTLGAFAPRSQGTISCRVRLSAPRRFHLTHVGLDEQEVTVNDAASHAVQRHSTHAHLLPRSTPRLLPLSSSCCHVSPATRSASADPSSAAARFLLNLSASALQLLPDMQLSGVRLRTRARHPVLPQLACFSARVGHTSATFRSLTALARPALCDVVAASCHFFHLCSFPSLLRLTVICPPTPQINSSISHHDFPFVEWSAQCCSSGTRFIFTSS